MDAQTKKLEESLPRVAVPLEAVTPVVKNPRILRTEPGK